jgi:hypothetical protein
MHDLDRTQPEYHQHHHGMHPGHHHGMHAGQCGDANCGGEHHHHHHQGGIHFPDVPIHGHDEDTYPAAGHDPASGEALELELASELLEVTNEQELDHFLGGLISKVGKGIGSFVHSPIGQALGGVLKDAAKKALPIAGSALGSVVGGPVGGMIGGKLASAAGNMFGLELEGLSPEDREFEEARGFVRLASEATRLAEMNEHHHGYGWHPRRAARSAFLMAARRFGPGYLRPGYHHHRHQHSRRPFYPQYPAPPEPPMVAVPADALQPGADGDDGDPGEGEIDSLGHHPSAPYHPGLHTSVPHLTGRPAPPHLAGIHPPAPPHLAGIHPPAPPHLAGIHPPAPPHLAGRPAPPHLTGLQPPAPPHLTGLQPPAPPHLNGLHPPAPPSHQVPATPIPGHPASAPPMAGYQVPAPPMPEHDVFGVGQHANGSQHQGRWIRRGRRIILYGV